MAITTPPEITPYPEAPQRNQAESVFVPLANTFVASLEPRRVEMQALADWMKVTGDTVHQELQGAADAATQQAEAARDDARLAETGAQTAQGLAEGARDDALDAAEAAEGAARTFEDTAAGLAATGEGEYFTVPSASATGYLDLYRHEAGEAALKRTSASDAVVAQAEQARDESRDARDISQANANFKGRWVDQVGALAIPASVYHKGKYWMLLDALADVTAAEPGESGSWDYLYDGNPLAFGPGPQTLIAGDMTAGFFGEVSADELFRGDELALMVGVTEGVAQNSTAGWLKFAHNNKIKYIAKQTFRHAISWDHLYSRGIVYGTDDDGVAPRGTATNQLTTVDKDGSQFVVRLMTCANSDPFAESDPLFFTDDMHQMDIGGGSEWNELIYRVCADVPSDPLTDGMQADRHGGPQVGANWAAYTASELNITTGNGRYAWGQEHSDATSAYRVLRGYGGLAGFSRGIGSGVTHDRGWRPCLELIPNT